MSPTELQLLRDIAAAPDAPASLVLSMATLRALLAALDAAERRQ